MGPRRSYVRRSIGFTFRTVPSVPFFLRRTLGEWLSSPPVILGSSAGLGSCTRLSRVVGCSVYAFL
eukprot:2645358-Pyramimonas_sp.AAC.1